MKKSAIEKAAADCRAAFKGVKVGALVQHCHHGEWLEILTEPPENRIQYILEFKPEHERIERLLRFRPVDVKKLPKVVREARVAYNEAWAAYGKARAEYDKAGAAYYKARAERDKAGAAYGKAWAALDEARAAFREIQKSPTALAFHKKVCGCPWSATKDIFGAKQ